MITFRPILTCDLWRVFLELMRGAKQGKKQVRSHCVSLTSPGHATASILEEMVPEVRKPRDLNPKLTR
jgi:hypothetical protein